MSLTRILPLLLFAYLVYRYLIKPIFLEPKREERPPKNIFEAMLRKQQEQQRQYQEQQRREREAPKQAENPKGSRYSGGEYIDYEEVKD